MENVAFISPQTHSNACPEPFRLVYKLKNLLLMLCHTWTILPRNLWITLRDLSVLYSSITLQPPTQYPVFIKNMTTSLFSQWNIANKFSNILFAVLLWIYISDLLFRFLYKNILSIWFKVQGLRENSSLTECSSCQLYLQSNLPRCLECIHGHSNPSFPATFVKMNSKSVKHSDVSVDIDGHLIFSIVSENWNVCPFGSEIPRNSELPSNSFAIRSSVWLSDLLIPIIGNFRDLSQQDVRACR